MNAVYGVMMSRAGEVGTMLFSIASFQEMPRQGKAMQAQ
jgi:hypothetical protein